MNNIMVQKNSSEIKKIKVAVFVNTLNQRGGIERIALYLHQRYKPRFFVGIFNPQTTFSELKDINIQAYITGKQGSKLSQLGARRWFSKIDVSNDFDVFINLGGISAEMASKKNRPMILYCSMPISYLYHGYKSEMHRHNILLRPLYYLLFAYLRFVDKIQLHRMSLVFANSGTTKENLRVHTNTESIVNYAPTDIKSYYNKTQKGFYLYVGRIELAKRPQIILEAFKTMPDKRLVIAGSGSELENLKKSAEGYSNIDVKGPVSESELRELYATCIATIYPTTKEDFGLVPIESMASGKPCIATNEAGFKETILSGKTGILLNEISPATISEAVKELTPSRCASMKKDCLERAKIFSLEAFCKKFDEAILNLAKQRLKE